MRSKTLLTFVLKGLRQASPKGIRATIRLPPGRAESQRHGVHIAISSSAAKTMLTQCCSRLGKWLATVRDQVM